MRAALIQVIRAEFTRGRGVYEDDPVRMVVGYYLPNGTLIAEDDPCKRDEVEELKASLEKARECIALLRLQRLDATPGDTPAVGPG